MHNELQVRERLSEGDTSHTITPTDVDDRCTVRKITLWVSVGHPGDVLESMVKMYQVKVDLLVGWMLGANAS